MFFIGLVKLSALAPSKELRGFTRSLQEMRENADHKEAVEQEMLQPLGEQGPLEIGEVVFKKFQRIKGASVASVAYVDAGSIAIPPISPQQTLQQIIRSLAQTLKQKGHSVAEKYIELVFVTNEGKEIRLLDKEDSVKNFYHYIRLWQNQTVQGHFEVRKAFLDFTSDLSSVDQAVAVTESVDGEEQSPATLTPVEEQSPATSTPVEEQTPDTSTPVEEQSPTTSTPVEEQTPATSQRETRATIQTLEAILQELDTHTLTLKAEQNTERKREATQEEKTSLLVPLTQPLQQTLSPTDDTQAQLETQRTILSLDEVMKNIELEVTKDRRKEKERKAVQKEGGAPLLVPHAQPLEETLSPTDDTQAQPDMTMLNALLEELSHTNAEETLLPTATGASIRKTEIEEESPFAKAIKAKAALHRQSRQTSGEEKEVAGPQMSLQLVAELANTKAEEFLLPTVAGASIRATETKQETMFTQAIQTGRNSLRRISPRTPVATQVSTGESSELEAKLRKRQETTSAAIDIQAQASRQVSTEKLSELEEKLRKRRERQSTLAKQPEETPPDPPQRTKAESQQEKEAKPPEKRRQQEKQAKPPEQKAQSPSATASAISSFDELFQMHITENEEHMKRIKDEFEGRSGVTSQNVAETFKTAKNQNVAWATYIVLRSSGSYPTLVNKSTKHSQRIQAQYAQLAQQFAQSPEVQEFIEQLREQKVTKVTQSSSATASAISSFDELFQMHITENEKHMKRIKDEFEGRSGVTSQNVAETFKTAKNQNVAWATYIVLRSSGSYPTLVNKSTKPFSKNTGSVCSVSTAVCTKPRSSRIYRATP